MYRVMLVDDELWTLKSLQFAIDWESMGFTVCSAHTNAREALESIASLSPDLVFVDIRMPDMDGLTFLREVKALWPQMLTVILSGYSEFHYAREAIGLGVIGYCLKPLDMQEIASVLAKARSALQTRRSPAGTAPGSISRQAAVDLLLEKLSDGRLPPLPLDLLVTRRLPRPLTTSAFSLSMETEDVFLYAPAQRESVLRELASRWTSGGIACLADRDERSLQEALQKAHCARFKPFLGFPIGAYFYTHAEITPLKKAVEGMLAHVKAHETLPAANGLDRLGKLLSDGTRHIDHALTAYNWAAAGLGLGTVGSVEELDARYTHLPAMMDALLASLSSGDSTLSLFRKITRYMQENLEDPDLFRKVKELSHYSDSGLSRLFKRCAGLTFTEYKINLKMERAQELLKNTDMPIEEIRIQCGFSDYFYFARQFKPKHRMTPSRWRSLHRREQPGSQGGT